MFQKIIVPVDLAHTHALTKAIKIAIDLAQEQKAELCFVGVTGSAPSVLARSPEEYAQKLDAFAQSQAQDLPISSHAVISNDPSIDTDRALEELIKELQADLVVMATHLPDISDYFWSGHGAHIATHSNASVFLVR